MRYLQTEFNNALKRSYALMNLPSFQELKKVSEYIIGKHNIAYKQKKGQKS
jgi:hypothetical protein